jgi:glutamate 5-kinase
VPRITAEIEAMAGSAGSELSRGGMKTKIDAGKIATAAGTSMVITSGKELNPLKRLEEGARGTWFPALSSPANARKAWIGGTLEPRGEIRLDAGAVKAMNSGKSLLPAGVTAGFRKLHPRRRGHSFGARRAHGRPWSDRL